jgi:DNA-binding CsgD family transcriptional regulator
VTRHAAGPDAARTAARADPGLVGRAPELARLRERLGRAAAGRPGVALVTGPEGIGKTALLDALVRVADGARVVRAGGDELEARLPLAAAEQLARRLGDPAAAAALAGGPDPPAAGAELLRLLSAAASGRPLLVVLDDAQWVDGPSLAALTYAMRRIAAEPVMLAVASRDDAVARLPAGLRRLALEERGLDLPLAGLRAHALAELAARMGGELLSPRGAARLREHTGGNPRHAAALLAELEPGALDRADLPLPAPRGSREPFLARLGALSPGARGLAGAAAVLGRRAPLGAAARMAGLGDPLPALREAIDAGLLALVERPGGRELAFPEPLARGAVYHDLDPVRRAELHAAAAGLTAGDVALAHRAAAALVPDAALAEDLAAAARRELARAPAAAGALQLAAARAEPDPARAERLLLAAIEMLLDGGEAGQAAALEPELAAVADGPARAAALGRLALARGRAAEAETLLADAWSRSSGPARAEVALRLAELACVRGAGGAVRDWAGRVLAGAAATGPRRDRALALLALGHGLEGAVEEGLRLLPGGPDAAPETGVARGILRLAAGDAAEAVSDLEPAPGPGADGPGPAWRLAALAALALAERRLGRGDTAVAHAERGLALARDGGQRWLRGILEAVLAALLAERGELGAAWDHLAEAAGLAGETALGTVAGAAAWAAVEAGAAGDDPALALERLAGILGSPDAAAPSPPGASLRVPGAAEALAELGRGDEADRLLAPLEGAPPADPAARAAVARARGVVDAARGRPSAGAFARARALLAGLAAPLEAARLDEAEGRALRRAGDRRAAAARLDAARAAYARLGARPARARCERELAACGPAGRGARARQRPLTPQERAVAELVAAGLTNRAIAERLVVSVKTVEFHLANAFAKTGVRSRTQLAVALVRDRAPRPAQG